MSEEEKRLIDITATLWNEFIKLEVYHREDGTEVRHHIHAIQAIVMCREAVRNNPDLFSKPELKAFKDE